MTTPIAVFIYNRPDHTRQLLDSLIKCTRLDECVVYIYCDGARNLEHIANIKAARQVAREFSLSLNNTHIIVREQNMGLARSIVDGVSQLCEQYGRVVVLEDDLVLHAQFLNYMISALDRYEHQERIAQISGYMFPVQHASTPDAFFLPFTSTWGWATWQRSWHLFEWEPDIAPLNDPGLRNRFNLEGVSSHATMLEDRLAKKNQSWGVLFYWAVFRAGKLVLHPRVSLVQNNGFDGSGVHNSRQVQRKIKFIKALDYQWIKGTDIIWPVEVSIDWAAYGKIQGYKRSSSNYFAKVSFIFQSYIDKINKMMGA